MCHEGKCVPEAMEKKDSYCESLDSGAAALQVRPTGHVAMLLTQSIPDSALCTLSPLQEALSM